jgi:hypothetical protein
MKYIYIFIYLYIIIRNVVFPQKNILRVKMMVTAVILGVHMSR